jgi:KaiC/GvpD/RAD55 family RecA-like ATPase
MTARTSTGIQKLDDMLGGGLLPGTLCVVYGATGIGKTHLGLHFAHAGQAADGSPGIFFDMNARGDSQQHHEYAARLYDWKLARWTHTVTPMTKPFPPAEQMAARYCDALPWMGKLRDYQVPTPDGSLELDWNWKAEYNHALYTVRPFVYFHLAAGCRRIVVDGIEPMDVPGDYIQTFLFDELYRKTIHRDSETLGMEICLPVWKHRAFIDGHRYDHAQVTTLLLVTTEETQFEHLIARKVAVGDIGAVANTIVVMGSERVGNRLGRFLYVVKHRGSAKSDDIAEYRVTERGVEFV